MRPLVMRDLSRVLARVAARRDAALENLEVLKAQAQSSAAALSDHDAALKAAADVAETIQREAHGGVAAVVSRCLSSVFDDPYEFSLEFRRARGRTEARCVFKRGGEEVDPQGGSGGGAVDVAALALNLACLVMSRPQPRKLLVMDEPLRFVHGARYRDRVAELLIALSDELGVQIVMATGVKEFAVGNVIGLS